MQRERIHDKKSPERLQPGTGGVVVVVMKRRKKKAQILIEFRLNGMRITES